MKKFLSIILALVMVTSLSACGSEPIVNESVNKECNHENVRVVNDYKQIMGSNVISLTHYVCKDCGYKWEETPKEYANLLETLPAYENGYVLIDVEGKFIAESSKAVIYSSDDYIIFPEICDEDDLLVDINYKDVNCQKVSGRYNIKKINISPKIMQCYINDGNGFNSFLIEDGKTLSVVGNISEVNSFKVTYFNKEDYPDKLGKSRKEKRNEILTKLELPLDSNLSDLEISEMVIRQAFEKGNGNGIERIEQPYNTKYTHKTIQGVDCIDIHGYYVPTVLGYPEYTEKEMQKFFNSNPTGKEVQEKIRNIADWINYVYLCKWPHDTSDCLRFAQHLDSAKTNVTWQVVVPGVNIVEYRGGMCTGASTAFAYVLKDDYQEIGYLYKDGHFFNYVKNGDKYYIINPSNWDSPTIEKNKNWSTGYYGNEKVDLPIVCDDLQELADAMKEKGISNLMYSCVACGSLIPCDRNRGFFPKGATAVGYTGKPVSYQDYNMVEAFDFTDFDKYVDSSKVEMTINPITGEINPDPYPGQIWITREDYLEQYGKYIDHVRW